MRRGHVFVFLFFYEVSCSAGRRGIWGNFENGREGNRNGNFGEWDGKMVIVSCRVFFCGGGGVVLEATRNVVVFSY